MTYPLASSHAHQRASRIVNVALSAATPSFTASPLQITTPKASNPDNLATDDARHVFLPLK
jgi:hypothetical protein